MMHSFIISGGTASEQSACIVDLCKTWNVRPFDKISPDETLASIGIGEIRTITNRLSLSPDPGHTQVAIITKGELLTLPAQQALLKTLEEPPAHSHIIICVPNSSHLLPTIRSRCQIIQLAFTSPYSIEQLTECREALLTTAAASLGSRIAWCQTVGKTRDDFVTFLHLSIASLRDGATRIDPTTQQGMMLWRLLRRLVDASQYIDTNVNLPLVVEHLMLSI